MESNLKCRAAERKSVEVRSPCQKSRACLYLHDHQMHRASTLWRKCTWGQSFLEEAITAEPSLISAPFTKVRDHWKEKGRNGKQKLVDFFHPYLYLQFLKGKKSLNTVHLFYAFSDKAISFTESKNTLIIPFQPQRSTEVKDIDRNERDTLLYLVLY